MKKLFLTLLVAAGITATAQVKVGTNPTTLPTNANFQLEGTTTADQFIVLKNGNVGIGTTTPNSRLNVLRGTSGEIGPAITPSAPVLSIQRAGTINDKWGATANFELGTFEADISARTQMDIKLAHGGTETPDMTVMSLLSNGNVGIGNTSPAAKLDISNSSSNSGLLKLNRGSSFYEWYVADNFNNANWSSNAADYLGNGRNMVCVRNLAGVGMHVFGDDIGPWENGAYNLGLSYARWANIFLTNSPDVSSDARLKSKVFNLQYGIETVMKLSPKSYDKYNNFEKSGEYKHELGFIAQELQDIVPEAVTGSPSDKNPMGVMYEQLIPVLTKAIQDLKQEVDNLKAELLKIKSN